MNLLLILAVAAFIALLIRTILVRAPRYGKPFLLRVGLILLLLTLFAMAITGRLHWLAALFSAALPFIGRISRWLAPLLFRLVPIYQQRRRQQQAHRKSSQQRSEVSSLLLHMVLDHDTGTVSGNVHQGTLAGRSLDSLSVAELRELHQACREQDPEGLRLLETYLQRHRSNEWDGPQAASTTPGEMDVEEALAILGLSKGATREEIITAHKRMMARMHPDKGGSNYLAAKINQAKELLLQQA